MAWSGGTYRKSNYSTNGWTGDASLAIGIEAGRHDTQDDDFAQGINDCINRNGSNSAGANLPMGGYKHTNVAQATTTTDYSRFDQVMDRAGTQAATANLSLGGFKITNVANGTVTTDAATFGQLTTVTGVNTPVGVISMYGGAAAPTGWLLCDGSAVSRTTYAALFAILSTVYGAGDGSTTFNIPNLQQRFPLGKAASGTGSTLGGTGGAIDHTHTSAAHTHTVASHVHGMGSHTHTVTHSHTLSDAGGAAIDFDATNLWMRRPAGAYAWTTTHVANPTQGWTSTAVTKSNSVSLIGNTDSATPTSSGPSVANTDATALTTDSTTPGATGTNNPPFLAVNYIIKT